jgi:hypothetical protein
LLLEACLGDTVGAGVGLQRRDLRVSGEETNREGGVGEEGKERRGRSGGEGGVEEGRGGGERKRGEVRDGLIYHVMCT